MYKIYCLIIGSILNFTAFCQDSLLVEAISQNLYEMNIVDDQLVGEGAEVIANSLKEHQFILVGEQHGIREVGQFTKHLFEQASGSGFDYFCLETDPYIASLLENHAEKEVTDLEAFCKEFPFAIPFYDNLDDFEMLKSIKSMSNTKGKTFWGVDQVFAAAPRYLFQQLMINAPNEQARQLARNYLQKGKEGVKHFLEKGDQSQTLMATLKAEDYEKLLLAFGQDNALESTKMLEAIMKTQEIYGYWFAGKQYQNNRTRAELMKKQFMDYYKEATKEVQHPKVVFKFGSTHTYRGLSYYDQYDLGNMVSELAEMDGNKSLHINFSGIQGKTFAAFQGSVDFDNSKDIHPLVWEAIQSMGNKKNWILVDLRPLRNQFNKKALAPIRELVYGYDMLVFVPEATALSAFK